MLRRCAQMPPSMLSGLPFRVGDSSAAGQATAISVTAEHDIGAVHLVPPRAPRSPFGPTIHFVAPFPSVPRLRLRVEHQCANLATSPADNAGARIGWKYVVTAQRMPAFAMGLRRGASATPHCIAIVLRRRPGVQVVGVHAGRIVAVMADPPAIRQAAAEQQEREPVRFPLPSAIAEHPVGPHVRTCLHGQRAVPVPAAAPTPFGQPIQVPQKLIRFHERQVNKLSSVAPCS